MVGSITILKTSLLVGLAFSKRFPKEIVLIGLRAKALGLIRFSNLPHYYQIVLGLNNNVNMN